MKKVRFLTAFEVAGVGSTAATLTHVCNLRTSGSVDGRGNPIKNLGCSRDLCPNGHIVQFASLNREGRGLTDFIAHENSLGLWLPLVAGINIPVLEQQSFAGLCERQWRKDGE
jgi:hypothetical protein